MSESEPSRPRGRHWLSVGFGDLAVRISEKADAVEPDFDVLIIGSGYGGSIAAHQLANYAEGGRPLSIGILERGQEYTEGEFPAEPGDLPPHVRFAFSESERAMGVLDGLFDFRFGPDVASLVGNGLGGGSLINAGVMIRPLQKVFNGDWPANLRGGELSDAFDACEKLLGAAPLEDLPQKFHALNALSGGKAKPAHVTIATTADDRFNACNYCGNCATGCNFGAKRSLDVQLLADAREANDKVEIFTGAAVERIERTDGGWIAHTGYTEAGMRARYPDTIRVTARRLIIAAGTYGSTELLMKSASDDLELSPALGERFSTNGDMLAVSYDHDSKAHAVADGAGARTTTDGVGPTITGVFDDREENDFLIEEMNVPWPIRGLFEEVYTTANTLADLAEFNGETHRAGFVSDDPYAVNERAIEHSSVLAVMGLDDAKGKLVLKHRKPKSEGVLTARWKGFNQDPLFDNQRQRLEALAGNGRIIMNPAWRPLPPSMAWFAGAEGPLFTVHPLGGCAMADTGAKGVVNDLGQVFVGDTNSVYDDLVVLDGSVIPTSLGANPALTISAVAHRAVESLAEKWQLDDEPSAAPRALPQRPVYRAVTDTPVQPTEVELRERMFGEVPIRGLGDCIVELTLQSGPTQLKLLNREVEKKITLLPSSRVRVFDKTRYTELVNSDPLESLDKKLEEIALASAFIEGELSAFPRVKSFGLTRTLRALGAWWLNRGMRDIWQEARERILGLGKSGDQSWVDFVVELLLSVVKLPVRIVRGGYSYAKQAVQLASHAGEKRAISYRLKVVQTGEESLFQIGDLLEGDKLITYGRASNPLKQLMELTLTRFPKMQRGRAVLTLDSSYLARIGVPLFRILSQRDTPTALGEFIGVGTYLLRMLFGIHAWTLRKPDEITDVPMRRLPGRLPNVEHFEQFAVPHPTDKTQHLPAILTRYKKAGGKPVVLLHGYSASGTTFAHECLKPSAAEFLWKAGRDVWVLDLRTSAGLPTATQPWTFEDVADGDIPQAIHHIWNETKQPIDVIAHCMGSAMFSMSVLSEDSHQHPLRTLMRERIDKVVMTQVGPGVVFSPANIFRAYAMTFLKHFLELSRYDFRVKNQAGLVDTLLDRLLNVLPYPTEEFFIENPRWPWSRAEFVSMRHRMDLLYGQDFSLTNVTDEFLENIDAMFGPLNLDTVSQAMLFTRSKNITDKQGRNRYYLRHRIREHWDFRTLSIHGRDNGLSSVETIARNEQVLRDAGVDYETCILDDFGHQDIWVSERSEEEVFPKILDFLDDSSERRPRSGKRKPLVGRPPFLGPVLCSTGIDGTLTVKVGTGPNLGSPETIVLVDLDEDYPVVPSNPLKFEEITGFKPDERGMVQLKLTTAGPRLILMLYDEHPALLDATFGDAVEMPAIDREYEEGDPARVRDAVEAALRLSPSLLETGVIQKPSRRTDESPVIAFASCQFPAGMLDGGIAYRAWDGLLEHIRNNDAPDMLLLLGDQVYVDPTGGLFDPARLADRYRIPYERWLSDDHVQRVLGRVPTYMMLDDHELKNDWEPLENAQNRRALETGEAAFRSYQFVEDSPRNNDKFWGEIPDAPVPTFMLNTRTDRVIREPGKPKKLISDEQMTALQAWLTRVDDNKPKLITSSSLPLPRHVPRIGGKECANTLDGWDGYTETTYGLLAFIAKRGISNVVFLSGDEHWPVGVTATLKRGEETLARVTSVHTTPLYAPIPFANARPEDFLLHDRFEIGDGIVCEVSGRTYSPDAGFSYATFEKNETGHHMRIRFEGSGDEDVFALSRES